MQPYPYIARLEWLFLIDLAQVTHIKDQVCKTNTIVKKTYLKIIEKGIVASTNNMITESKETTSITEIKE